eukprot:gene16019-21744_t
MYKNLFGIPGIRIKSNLIWWWIFVSGVIITLVVWFVSYCYAFEEFFTSDILFYNQKIRLRKKNNLSFYNNTFPIVVNDEIKGLDLFSSKSQNGELAVYIPSTSRAIFRNLGGTNHLYHMLQNLLPFMEKIENSLFITHSAVYGNKYNNTKNRLYLIFENKNDLISMDGLNLLMFLSATVSSKMQQKLSEVILCHSSLSEQFKFSPYKYKYLRSNIALFDDRLKPRLIYQHGTVQIYAKIPIFDYNTSSRPLEFSAHKFSNDQHKKYLQSHHFYVLYAISWMEHKPLSESELTLWQFSNTFTHLRQSVFSFCQLKKHSFDPVDNYPIKYINSTVFVRMKELDQYFKHLRLNSTNNKFAKSIQKHPENSTENYAKKLQDSKSKPLLLIYQRDKTRTIDNIDYLLREFRSQEKLTSQWNIQVYIHKNMKAPLPENVKNQSIVQNLDSPLTPCGLISLIHQTDILLTPHGFQSTLLLFQPLKSSLIEISPFNFNPILFGRMQAYLNIDTQPLINLASNLSKDQFYNYPHRQYLQVSSQPTYILTKWMLFLQKLRLTNLEYWIHNSVFRYFIKKQNVQVTDIMIENMISFIHDAS